ncbi:glutamate--tRNA ligase family protein [Nafulsella turpanensis]|uniref:glutamate--tRNA ligase family protein n=1 Tax=Nafulsella turpanensis TaxID=1265690 RepID=UPI00034875D4|nr:glutamate--tRNA ligase family protein [Nafulsella turpanensis]
MEENQEGKVLSRIAPTPSGYLHVGNAFSFVLTWLITRKSGGKLLLRIDDNDATRSRPAYIEDIFYTLDWLGIDYELGPEGPDDFRKHYSQHHRLPLYQQLLEGLKSRPGLVYACTCSRKQILEKSINGVYPGTCRPPSPSAPQKPAALRIHVPEETLIAYRDRWTQQEKHVFLGKEMGDFVIRRKDQLPAYQIASLADDLHFGVNLIVRGQDLHLSTAAQLYLAQCLSVSDSPLAQAAKGFEGISFVHHSLMLDEKGQKLSKSKGAAAIAELRKAGKSPLQVYRQVAHFAGIPLEAATSLESLLSHFHFPPFQGK